MQFGIFYEHQLPRPWRPDSELQLYQQSLDQVELADQLGFDAVWAVEHHFLEEYSHLASPEIFLAACSQRTRRIRLGHGIVQTPAGFNHPVKVAERIATLDLVSAGRVEFGTGESNSRLELEGFAVDRGKKRAMWLEATQQACDMMALTPYPGSHGQFAEIPVRNVVPKPVQQPHPPVWVACSSLEGIRHAARNGLGALTFAFVDHDQAHQWVEQYYRTFEEQCEPIAHQVNPNIAMVTGLSCHAESSEAHRRASEGLRFFGYALAHFYFFGWHRPGATDIWREFLRTNPPLHQSLARGIGTPDEIRDSMQRYAEAGVDQLIFIVQSGQTRHDHICESMRLFAREVMPTFQQDHPRKAREKADRLAPAIDSALRRRTLRQPPQLDQIQRIAAYGRPDYETGFLPKPRQKAAFSKTN